MSRLTDEQNTYAYECVRDLARERERNSDIQAEIHYICEWLTQEIEKERVIHNYPRAKTLEQVVGKIKEADLWT